MKKIRVAVAIAALAALAGCSSPRSPQPQYTPPAYTPPPPVQLPIPERPAQSAPQSTAPKPMANDQCGAAALQYLIGRPRTDIPVPLMPSTRRVVCSTCVVTQEYRADRQTIVFDSDTGMVKSVTCG